MTTTCSHSRLLESKYFSLDDTILTALFCATRPPPQKTFDTIFVLHSGCFPPLSAIFRWCFKRKKKSPPNFVNVSQQTGKTKHSGQKHFNNIFRATWESFSVGDFISQFNPKQRIDNCFSKLSSSLVWNGFLLSLSWVTRGFFFLLELWDLCSAVVSCVAPGFSRGRETVHTGVLAVIVDPQQVSHCVPEACCRLKKIPGQ